MPSRTPSAATVSASGGGAAALPAAVCWDLDGTLADSEPFWIAGEYALVERFGGTWSQEHAHAIVGKPLLVSAAYIRENSPVTLTGPEIVEELLGYVVSRLREAVPWRPGALELLDALAEAGVPSAMVTMSYRVLAQTVAEAAARELGRVAFREVVAGDEVTHGKPHPEPYLTAAARLGVRPQECVAIEDSPAGVASAHAAGMRVIGVPNMVSLATAPADAVLTTLAGLTPPALLTAAPLPPRVGDAPATRRD